MGQRAGDDCGRRALNNCLPLLWERTEAGWKQVYRGTERTREPCPLAVGPDGRVVLSVNPTLTPPDTYGGPRSHRSWNSCLASPPQRREFARPCGRATRSLPSIPTAALPRTVIVAHLFCFKTSATTTPNGRFATGQATGPLRESLSGPGARNTTSHSTSGFVTRRSHSKGKAFISAAVSDIIEPYTKWREYKKKLTGRDWDYDFRRLFYTWCDDVTTGQFHDWVEISSRDKTCGWIFPNDVYLSPTGDCFVLWNERAIDERLREAFYPDAKQRQSLELAVLHDGAISRAPRAG